MRYQILAGLLLATTSVSPVYADWAYTRWGMTPAEVIAASKGAAKKNPDAEKQSTDTAVGSLAVPYQSGEFAFTAVFLFDRGSEKLVGVKLRLNEPARADALYGALIAKYGKPLSEGATSASTSARWIDREANNNVVLFTVPGFLSAVDYGPAVDQSNSGL